VLTKAANKPLCTLQTKARKGNAELKTVVTNLTYEFLPLKRILLSLRFVVMTELVSGVIRTAAGDREQCGRWGGVGTVPLTRLVLFHDLVQVWFVNNA